jgi:hypothetical protein
MEVTGHVVRCQVRGSVEPLLKVRVAALFGSNTGLAALSGPARQIRPWPATPSGRASCS